MNPHKSLLEDIRIYKLFLHPPHAVSKRNESLFLYQGSWKWKEMSLRGAGDPTSL